MNHSCVKKKSELNYTAYIAGECRPRGLRNWIHSCTLLHICLRLAVAKFCSYHIK